MFWHTSSCLYLINLINWFRIGFFWVYYAEKKMKIALGIEYNGKRHFGWQRQENLLTVQGELKRRLHLWQMSLVRYFVRGERIWGYMPAGKWCILKRMLLARKSWCWRECQIADILRSLARIVDKDFHEI